MIPKWMVVLAVGFAATHANAEEQVLNTKKDMLSYGIGVNVAKTLKKDEVDIDTQLLLKGLQDGLAGAHLLMPERKLRLVMNDFQGELRRKQMLNHAAAAEENMKKEQAFLDGNKNKDGVVTLASGMQYKILEAGKGKKPTDTDTVDCYYRGTLLNGTEFDGTEPGKPATLKLSMLIEGWKEALKLMPAGSKWQIFIPSRLAYGSRGVGSDIGPNETLVFEVALLDIK